MQKTKDKADENMMSSGITVFRGFLLYTVMYIDYIFIYYIFFAGTSPQLFFIFLDATFKFLGTHL